MGGGRCTPGLPALRRGKKIRCLNVIIKFRASLGYVERLMPLIPLKKSIKNKLIKTKVSVHSEASWRQVKRGLVQEPGQREPRGGAVRGLGFLASHLSAVWVDREGVLSASYFQHPSGFPGRLPIC